MPGPITSEDATTEGSASEMGRTLLGSNALAVSGFPASPIMTVPVALISTWGYSFLKARISCCCFLYLEQFSPLEQWCGFGMTCSIPMMDTDSIGVISSLFVLVRFLRLLLWRRLSPLSSGLRASLTTSLLGTSSIGVSGRGDAGRL